MCVFYSDMNLRDVLKVIGSAISSKLMIDSV